MKLSYKITIGVLIVLLVLAIAAGFFLADFYSYGVHTFGKAIHYEIFESAYWVGSGEMTNLTVHGTYDGAPYNGGAGSFNGYLQVGDYPVPFSYANAVSGSNGKGILLNENDGYLISIAYEAVVGQDEEIPVFSDYWYSLILNPENPEQIIICVYDRDNNPLGAVVNASTLEEAQEIYRAYSSTLE